MGKQKEEKNQTENVSRETIRGRMGEFMGFGMGVRVSVRVKGRVDCRRSWGGKVGGMQGGVINRGKNKTEDVSLETIGGRMGWKSERRVREKLPKNVSRETKGGGFQKIQKVGVKTNRVLDNFMGLLRRAKNLNRAWNL